MMTDIKYSFCVFDETLEVGVRVRVSGLIRWIIREGEVAFVLIVQYGVE